MEHASYLPQVVLLLFTAVVVVAVFKRLNLSPVLGYLVAGAFIGEHSLGYINSQELNVFAEFGIVFLLFAIGLELTVERLMAMRWHVFGFGTLQVLLTTAIFSGVIYSFGLPIESSIVIGGALALSSTAIVLRVLYDSNGHSTQVGRLALANLLLQDFAVVPLLVIVPILANKEGDMIFTLGGVFVKALVAMFIIILLGRTLLRPLFKLIAEAKSNELFVAATLLVVLGTAFITEYFGLSLALGAFIAGLMVAETQYQHKVEDNILPFKDLLMGLFFMTVGMTIDIVSIYQNLALIIALSFALILTKALIITLLSRAFKFPWGSSIHAGLLLAQGSEFAFILFGLAAAPNIAIIDSEVAQILLLVVTVSMALTPSLSMLGQWINRSIMKKQASASTTEDTNFATFSDAGDLNRHVVVAGFGRAGKMVAKLLTAKRIHFIVVEADAKRAKEGKAEGFPVYHGDPTRRETLNSANVGLAAAVIVTIPEDVYMKKAVRNIHKHYPDVPIVVRAEDLRNAQSLKKIGATLIVPEKYESGLQLAGALLRAVGVTEVEISRLKNYFRMNNYELAKELVTPVEKD
jgi:CPA2 family monovalent cation:H+ antiporter-2